MVISNLYFSEPLLLQKFLSFLKILSFLLLGSLTVTLENYAELRPRAGEPGDLPLSLFALSPWICHLFLPVNVTRL